MKLLVTDLDNTLYDWVTYFSLSFAAMTDELCQLLSVDRAQILSEFRTVHQRYGDSEQPFAVLELPSVKSRFPEASRSELVDLLDRPLHRFNSTRKATLQLYPGVESTLQLLCSEGVRIVGHTEAAVHNAYFRLTKLNVAKYMTHLYALESAQVQHPRPDRSSYQPPAQDFVSIVPRSERKPNPALLADICKKENVGVRDTIYVGDSITRDVAMAKGAKVRAVWAKYGRNYAPEHWDFLVQITHWTDADVKQEQELKKAFGNIQPDFVVESFSDILKLFGYS